MNDLNTTFVLVSDHGYYHKAKRTIQDLRSIGQWCGSIVVISLDGFRLPPTFKLFHSIAEVRFPTINKDILLAKIRTSGFQSLDGRELNKINQWEKLHVFDPYFKAWERVIFLDAGLRVLDNVGHLLALPWRGRLLAPDDAGNTQKPDVVYGCQLSKHCPELINRAQREFGYPRGIDIMRAPYMLNCMWVYDTDLLDTVFKKEDLITVMNEFPMFRTNEMGVMNAVINLKCGVWSPFPCRVEVKDGSKYLFDWCEANIPGTSWVDYCFIKYSCTIGFDDV